MNSPMSSARSPVMMGGRNRSLSVGSVGMMSRGSTIVNLFADQELAKMLNSRVDENEVQQSRLELLRLRVKFILVSTWGGQMYRNIFLLLSVISSFIFIAQTYFQYEEHLSSRGVSTSRGLNYAELLLAAMFSFDWVLDLFIAEHKTDFIFSFFGIVDIITVIPTFVTEFAFPQRVSYDAIESPTDIANYLNNGFHTVRILRMLRVYKHLTGIEDPVRRFLYQLALTFITMLLFDAALIQYLELHVQPLEFHKWIYVMTVTMTTVGYGDISPLSLLGRFAIMAIMFFAIVFVPMQSNKLVEMMSRQSVYARARYKPRGLAQHVIICGDLKSTSLKDLFKELFHEDHENLNLHAVILQPEPPSFEMREILLDPVFSLVVHYIEGSPLLDMDLGRAKAETAVAIFLLSNKFCLDADAEDTKTILQELSIQRYIHSYGSSAGSDALFCMQLLRPENKKHLGDIDESESKLVVCLNEMKMGVLAKGCLFPGVSTLIFNLLSSFAEDEDPLAESAGANIFDPDATEEDEIGTWLEEYEQGCGWEIYTTELSEAFEGQKFVDLAYTLYDKIGIVLFALRIKELKGRQHVRVLLNPAEFVIPKKDDYFIEGFVVAKNNKQSDLRFASDEMSGSGPNPFHMLQSLTHFGGTAFSGGDGQGTGRRDSVASSGSGMTDNRRNSENLKKEASGRWQDIKADYDANREVQVGNAQELMSKQETDYLQSNYFLRNRPLTVEEVTIGTAVLDEVPSVNQHVIIIGKGLGNLYDFIRPWRAKYFGRLKHIVILTPFDINEAIWRRVSMFEGILIVKGSALEENDLRRAGIFKAAQVVVLADASNRAGNATSNSSDALEDADAIFSYQLVKRLNDKAHVVVEIIHTSNVSYLDNSLESGGGIISEADYKFTPQFASGRLFTSSLLDTVLCQAFYNPQIVKVVNKLITGTDHKRDEIQPSTSAKERKSRKSNVKVNSKLFDGMGSSLHQILVPDDLGKQTYGELFKYLSQRRMIPLGLLRGTFPAMGIGPKGNKLPYVYTNPSKDTEVFSCDKVFVLSQKSLNTTKHTADEIHENFLRQTEAAILMKKAELDAEGDTMLRGKDASIGRELDSYMKHMSGDLTVLFSAIQELKEVGSNRNARENIERRQRECIASNNGHASRHSVPKPGSVRRALDRQSSRGVASFRRANSGGDKSIATGSVPDTGRRNSRASLSDHSMLSSESPMTRPETLRTSAAGASRGNNERRRSSSSTISELDHPTR